MDPWDRGQHAGQGRAGQGTNKADDDRPSRGQADPARAEQPSGERAGVIFSYYQWVGQPHQMEQWSMERSQISLGRRKVAVEPRVKKGAVPCVKPCPLSGSWECGWVWTGDWGLDGELEWEWDWNWECPGLAWS